MKKMLTILICLQGCVVEPPITEDARDDSFIGDGKRDGTTLAEGSYEALAVLDLATTESPDVLLEPAPEGVGLSERIVDNLMNLRLGDDGRPGTADDVVFETLAQLDAVPFVGSIALRKMSDHAVAHPRCFAEKFGDAQRLPDVMTVAPSHVYFIGNPNTYPIEIWRASKGAPGIEKVTELRPENEYDAAIAADATHVYMAHGTALQRRPIAGGDFEIFDQGSGPIGGITTDATHVYWGDDFGLYRRVKAGGPRQTLALHPVQGRAFRSIQIVVDGTTLYWKTTSDKLLRMTIGSSVETPVAQNVKDFAVDATHIYVLTDNSSSWKDDTLVQIPKTDLTYDQDVVAFRVEAFMINDTQIIFSQPDGLVTRGKVDRTETKLTVTNPKGQLFEHVDGDSSHLYWMADRPKRLRRDACKL